MNQFVNPSQMLQWGSTTTAPSGGSGGLNFGAKGPAPFVPMSLGLGDSGPMSMPGANPAANRAPTISTAGFNPNMSMGDVSSAAINDAGTVDPQQDIGGSGGWFTNANGGLNLDSISTVGKTLASFGQLYAAFQTNKIAKDSLNFQKESYQTNLTNQLSSYNMALEDRANARAVQSNDPGSAAGYIDKHRLGA